MLAVAKVQDPDVIESAGVHAGGIQLEGKVIKRASLVNLTATKHVDVQAG